MSWSETAHPPKQEDSRTPPSCQTQESWVLPLGEKLTLAPLFQPRSRSLVIQDRMASESALRKADLCFAIDPGNANMGIAVFYKEYTRDHTAVLYLQSALQYTLVGCSSVLAGKAAFDIIMSEVKAFTPWLKSPPKVIDIIVEQQFARNSKLLQFRECLETAAACLCPEGMVMRVKTIAPRTVYCHLKVPPRETWEQRKKANKEFVENKFPGITFPRHDVADAVAIGAAAIDKGKIMLKALHLEEDPLAHIDDQIFSFDDVSIEPLEEEDVFEPISSSSALPSISEAFGPEAHAQKYNRSKKILKRAAKAGRTYDDIVASAEGVPKIVGNGCGTCQDYGVHGRRASQKTPGPL